MLVKCMFMQVFDAHFAAYSGFCRVHKDVGTRSTRPECCDLLNHIGPYLFLPLGLRESILELLFEVDQTESMAHLTLLRLLHAVVFG